MNHDRKFLFLFTGPPATGKTTVAKAFTKEVGACTRIMYLESDKLRHMIAFPTYSKYESKMVYSALRKLSYNALKFNYSVVVDATFTRLSYRLPFKTLAHRFDAVYYVFGFVCSLETAIRRNRKRTGWRTVPVDRLKGMYAHYQKEASDAVIDTEKLSIEEASKKVLDVLEHSFALV